MPGARTTAPPFNCTLRLMSASGRSGHPTYPLKPRSRAVALSQSKQLWIRSTVIACIDLRQ
jgi:hypothetical protein